MGGLFRANLGRYLFITVSRRNRAFGLSYSLESSESGVELPSALDLPAAQASSL